MELNLTTPSLLYPTVSLLLLAYTQRFLALAALIRSLHASYKEKPDPMILAQIDNLRFRIRLIRNMQACGVLSLLVCTICMFFIFKSQYTAANLTFGLSLCLMIISLLFSVREIYDSVKALDLHLTDLEHASEKTKST